MNPKFTKRTNLLACFALTLVLLIGPFATPGQAAEKVLKLKFSCWLPLHHPASKVMEEVVKELNETAKGKVEIQFYGASALGKGAEQYDITVEGLADMALICCAYWPSRFPLSSGVQLPFFSDSALTGAKLLINLKERGIFDDEFSEVQYLLPASTSPYQIFSNRKITKTEDFKGLRLLNAGTITRKIAKILGAPAINIATADSYLALQRRTGDAATTNWAMAYNVWKWHEVAKYGINISYQSGWHCGVIMNKQSWNKVPADVQSIWNDGRLSKYAIKIAEIYDKLDKESMEKWKETPGLEFVDFPESEKEKMAEMLIPIWHEWLTQHGEKGKELYRAYVETMKSLGEPVLVKIPELYQD